MLLFLTLLMYGKRREKWGILAIMDEVITKGKETNYNQLYTVYNLQGK